MYCPFSKPHWEDCSSYGEADSIFRGFQDYILQILFKNTNFDAALLYHYENHSGEGALYRRFGNSDHSRSITAHLLRTGHGIPIFDQWSIPSQRELAEMDQFANTCAIDRGAWKGLKNRFSAAAAAIRFLRSTPASTRVGFRNIVLHEDRQAVAYPESHVAGLIPFASENPNLHISHRVDMWRLFVGGHFVHDCNISGYPDGIFNPEEDWTIWERVRPSELGKYAGRLITEASALFTNGMPANAYSMMLDGSAAPEESKIMFDILKEEAAWQVAQMQWYAERSLHPGLLWKKAGGFYRSEAFPQVISDIVEGNSWIRCNFDPGNVYDPQLVLERNRSLEVGDARYPSTKWNRQWVIHNKRRFEPAPPAPVLISNLRRCGFDELIPEKIPGINLS